MEEINLSGLHPHPSIFNKVKKRPDPSYLAVAYITYRVLNTFKTYLLGNRHVITAVNRRAAKCLSYSEGEDVKEFLHQPSQLARGPGVWLICIQHKQQL